MVFFVQYSTTLLNCNFISLRVLYFAFLVVCCCPFVSLRLPRCPALARGSARTLNTHTHSRKRTHTDGHSLRAREPSGRETSFLSIAHTEIRQIEFSLFIYCFTERTSEQATKVICFLFPLNNDPFRISLQLRHEFRTHKRTRNERKWSAGEREKTKYRTHTTNDGDAN